MNEAIRARFEQKIRECFDAYHAAWLKETPAELIKRADEIATIQRMAKELPGSATPDAMEYLLRFKNPLQIVSDEWQTEYGPDAIIDEEMSHVLWNIVDKEFADAIYEMEPAAAGPPREKIPARESVKRMRHGKAER